ncbi:MAG: hypothetical protein ACKO2Z_33965 [Sphaerospermopsis kisseleviana]
MELQVGDTVKATITSSGGYWEGNYVGIIVGFTDSGKVKVKGRYKLSTRIRVHALHNVTVANSINPYQQPW